MATYKNNRRVGLCPTRLLKNTFFEFALPLIIDASVKSVFA